MTAREAILVDLQGVCSEVMLEASSMSEERGKRPEEPCAYVVAPILAFRCVPRADKDLPGIDASSITEERGKRPEVSHVRNLVDDQWKTPL